ncbi:MAG: SpoIIE family protein phosphatase [Bacteroidales bacterium]|nr:SpoIIE family protein phosphatase [Bacteroidales bacterium]
MKKILGFKVIANLALIVLLVGGLVYSLGFGICMYLARQEVTKESTEKVNLAIGYIQEHVDGQLQRVEDVAYTLLSNKFGKTTRDKDGNGFVAIDPTKHEIPTEDEVFDMLEQFLDANPQVCGVAIGFEKFLYTDTKGEYGFAAYVTNVSGRNERLSLGEIHDFHEKEWYANAANLNKPYWSRPFRETSMGKVVACFSLPLHGYDNRIIGVLALDINTESFREECTKATPFPNAQVAIADREFRFVSHPDTTFILRTIQETGAYDDYEADDSMRIKMKNNESGQYTVNEGSEREALFSFAPIKRTGWTISIESPRNDLYGGVERMKRDTTFIAIVSILIMVICFIFFFRHLQKVTMSKVGMESELKIASAIQMGMLPKLYPAFPDRKELDVYGFLKPAKSVGGDLYDYFIRNDKFFCCIGDVSGKGVPASLYMAVVRSLFRNVSLHEDNPAVILSQLNTALSEGNNHNMFCTMFLGIMDLKTGHVDFCNAGHNAPIIRQLKENGEVTVRYTKPKVNLAVGVIPDFPYEKEEIVLKPGEAIFLYTDGVTEAENTNKQLFGEEATMKALLDARDNGCKTAKEFVDHVYKHIQYYAADTEQSDDITMVVMEYLGTERN